MALTKIRVESRATDPSDVCALDDSRRGIERRSFLRGALGVGLSFTGAVGALVGFSPTASAAAAVRCDARAPTAISCGPSYHPCIGGCSETQSCCTFGPSGSRYYACCRCGGPSGCGRARVVVYAPSTGKSCYYCCQRC